MRIYKINCTIICKSNISFTNCIFKKCTISSDLYYIIIEQSKIDFINSHKLVLLYCTGTLNNCSGDCINHSYLYMYNSKFKAIYYSLIKGKNSSCDYAKYSNSFEDVITLSEHPSACPLEGEFIAYKYVKNYIIKLLIPADAKRSSAFGFKCRASYAKVLSINNIDNGKPIQSVSCTYYSPTTYTVGEFVYPDSFDSNRFNEYSHGIHFFLNKKDAINYYKGLI